MAFFTELEQVILIIPWKHKMPHIAKTIEKEEQSWRNHTPWLQTILQSYSHQNSIILAPKNGHRSMEENRKPRNKPTYLWSINLTEEARIYNEEKTVSSVSGAGKTGQVHVKEWNQNILCNTIYKNKLTMHLRPKWKTEYYKSTRGLHMQNTLWHKLHKF